MTTTVMPESPGVAVAPIRRDPYIDNVKGLLIVLVVLGHMVGQTVGSSPGGRTIYTFIYLCHMPAFVMLSGMLSATELTGRRAASLIRDLLAPYVVFQLLYMSFYTVMDKPMPWTVNEFLSPIYHLWFLPALFIWRMLAPLFAQLRGAIVIAIVVSLSAGAATVFGHALSLDRVAGMLPFFVLGVWLIANYVSAVVAQPLGLTDASIAWEAHVGGFIVGLMLFPLLDPLRARGSA